MPRPATTKLGSPLASRGVRATLCRVPRLPDHYRDFYLEPHNDGVRFSALPADLGRYVDDMAPPEQVFELAGTVLHFMKPRPLAARVGRVCASILPAALDDLVRRRRGIEESFFLDPFALWVVGSLPRRARLARTRLREQLVGALADHFESIDDLHHDDASPAACERLAAQVVDECEPQLTRFDVVFRFEVADAPRGARLLRYLYDVRPPSLAPEPWPERIVL